MPRPPPPTLTYSDALLRLWSAVRTGGWCLGCAAMHGELAGLPAACGCPCHEAEALLRATGVLPRSVPAKGGAT